MSDLERLVFAALLVVCLGFVAIADPLAHALYDTAEAEPEALTLLREQADAAPRGSEPPLRRAIVVVFDGMRRDEAAAQPAFRALERRAARAVVDLPLPTLSQPFYHSLFTGVPQNGTGVRANVQGRGAVLDTLAARVRSRGGRVEWLSDDITWMAPMFEAEGDVSRQSDPLPEGVFERLRQPLPTLLVIHLLSVDGTAHDAGIHTEAHRRALAAANAITSRVDLFTRATPETVLAVMDDHGHIERGGHGGDEPEVQRSFFWLVAPGLAPTEITRPLAVTEIAPTIAAWLGIEAPLSAVSLPARELVSLSGLPSARLSRRAALLERETRLNESRLAFRRGWALVLVAAFFFASAALLVRRDRRALVALPLVACVHVAVVVVIHVGVWERPLTLSALDNTDWRGPYLAILGACAAALAIAGATKIDPTRTGLARVAATELVVTLTLVFAAIAWCGGALGPWPLDAIGFYAPTLTIATGAGAALSAAIALGIALFLEFRAARARGKTPAPEGP